MNFIKEIASIINYDGGWRYVITANGGYFEGVKKVFSYEKCKVILIAKSGKVDIYGNNLCITKFFGEDLALSGKITSVVTE